MEINFIDNPDLAKVFSEPRNSKEILLRLSTISKQPLVPGKDYERHKALSNVMNSTTYQIPKAYVICNDNVKQVGKITYLPIYMLMFIEKEQALPTSYKIDLSGLA